MSYLYDPNYYVPFSSTNSLAPRKPSTVLGNSWSGRSYSNGYGLTQQQNLRFNRNYQLYQFPRKGTSVLTNNVTTLAAGNGAQFLGYGYIAGSGDNTTNIYV